MKIIKNKFIPFKGYKLMNFFGVIFQRNDVVVTETEYNHEKIHLVWYRIPMYNVVL